MLSRTISNLSYYYESLYISLWEFKSNYKTQSKILKGINLAVMVSTFNLGLLQHISTINLVSASLYACRESIARKKVVFSPNLFVSQNQFLAPGLKMKYVFYIFFSLIWCEFHSKISPETGFPFREGGGCQSTFPLGYRNFQFR